MPPAIERSKSLKIPVRRSRCELAVESSACRVFLSLCLAPLRHFSPLSAGGGYCSGKLISSAEALGREMPAGTREFHDELAARMHEWLREHPPIP